MISKALQILGYIFVWAMIVGCTVLFTMRGRAHSEKLQVSEVEISIVDSTERSNLVTVSMVQNMLSEAKLRPIGQAAKSTPLTQIEQVIAANGFVESVCAYIDYRGVLKIDVEQRNAVARILFDGYNSYITRDGYIFDAPLTAALYTSVITGDYTPPFPSSYTGSVDKYVAKSIAQLDLEIERVEREKYPIFLRAEENSNDRRAIRRRYINRSVFESKDDFAKRVDALREENRKLRELYSYRQKVIDSDLRALELKQERYRAQQKKLQKMCDDVHNLITFVEIVESDPFWRSEIVQIDISSGQDGDMRATLSVRSGSYAVTLGTLSSDKAEIRAKFNRLRDFYKDALPRVGWNRYREINIEFNNQVVCKR